MFDVSSHDVRHFFAGVWQRRFSGSLDALEQKAMSILLEHPEYHYVVEHIEDFEQTQWLPENGETNPFLHMSLHLSLMEQCAIDQPFGIAQVQTTLTQKYDSLHEAQHAMMDALVEMIWQAQRHGNGFDVNVYLHHLRHLANLPQDEAPRLNPHEV